MIKLATTYTAEQFATLVQRETDQVELKSGASPSKLQEAMVAMSNGEGGVIFIGVNDQRQVMGKILDQGVDDKIHEAALSAHDLGRYTIR